MTQQSTAAPEKANRATNSIPAGKVCTFCTFPILYLGQSTLPIRSQRMPSDVNDIQITEGRPIT
jgi:hypothetical protein